MSQEIMNDLTESIKKNMPAAVGEELQKLLQQGKDAIAKVKLLEEQIERYKGDIADQQKIIQAGGNLRTREESLKEKEKALDAQALGIMRKEAEMKGEIASARAQVYEKVFDTVFKNTVVRENVTASVPVAVPHTPPTPYNSNGSPAFVHQAHESVNKETSKE